MTTAIQRLLQGDMLSGSDGLTGYLSTFGYQGTLYGINNTATPYVIGPQAGGGGSVTSVTVLAPIPGLSVAGNNITVNGTIIITGTLGHGAGGTGLGATPTNGQTLIGNGSGFTLGTLTAGSGITITNSAGGIDIASLWGVTGTLVHLATSTHNVNIGGANDLGKFSVTGDADEIQLRVRAHSSQSAYLASFEDSSGNQQVVISGNGDVIINEEGNDADFRVETDGNANAFVVNGGTNNVGIGTNAPDEDVIFDVVSTTKASRPFPTMDSTQRDAIATPATASVIYNSTTTQYEYWDGAAWVALSGTSGSTPLFYRAGLGVVARTAALLEVGVGEITVESTIVSKTATTLLDMATAGDWIGGSSLESASEFVQIYADAAGNIKLYDKMPNYPRANTASRVADMRVNQVGWNGTGGSGLNATSIVYDTDTGEGSVTAGMLLGVFSDSTFETGRGRGSGAAASVNNASFALITAINTGTNTITVAAGHNIAINDNDYLIVIEYGSLEYINVSGTWWRLIDRMFNNSGSDLDENRTARMFTAVNDAGTNYTTTSASLVDIDSTNLACSILIGTGAVHGEFAGMFSRAAGTMRLDWAIDGLRYAGDDGITSSSDSLMDLQVPMTKRVLPGTHTVAIQWSCTSGGLYAGAGTATLDTHPIMNVYEVRT